MSKKFGAAALDELLQPRFLVDQNSLISKLVSEFSPLSPYQLKLLFMAHTRAITDACMISV